MVTPVRNRLYVKDGVAGHVRAARRFDTPDDDRLAMVEKVVAGIWSLAWAMWD